jgi:hypothetical protein
VSDSRRRVVASRSLAADTRLPKNLPLLARGGRPSWGKVVSDSRTQESAHKFFVLAEGVVLDRDLEMSESQLSR